MGWTFHLLIFEDGRSLDDRTNFVGTSLGSAAGQLRRHLMAAWPDEDWPDDVPALIERLNGDAEPVNIKVHHFTLDLEAALAHEHDGEEPTVTVIPQSSWRWLYSTLDEALDPLAHGGKPDPSGGDPDGVEH